MTPQLFSCARRSPGARALRLVYWTPAFAGALAIQGCVSVSAPTSIAQSPAAAVPVTVDGVPAGMQFLYASGEGAAVSIQAWNARLWACVSRAISLKLSKIRVRSNCGDGSACIS